MRGAYPHFDLTEEQRIMQIMGGAGYTMAHDMERLFRDARVGPIGGGLSEIQRNIIAALTGL